MAVKKRKSLKLVFALIGVSLGVLVGGAIFSLTGITEVDLIFLFGVLAVFLPICCFIFWQMENAEVEVMDETILFCGDGTTDTERKVLWSEIRSIEVWLSKWGKPDRMCIGLNSGESLVLQKYASLYRMSKAPSERRSKLPLRVKYPDGYVGDTLAAGLEWMWELFPIPILAMAFMIFASIADHPMNVLLFALAAFLLVFTASLMVKLVRLSRDRSDFQRFSSAVASRPWSWNAITVVAAILIFVLSEWLSRVTV